MDNKELTALIEGLLGLVPVFYPPAAPVVLVITKALPWVIAAGPVVKALVEEGMPAFEAAKAKAPKLAEAISELADIIPVSSQTMASPPAYADRTVHVENVARTVFGLPRMTLEQELAWMDKSVPPNDSRFGGPG